MGVGLPVRPMGRPESLMGDRVDLRPMVLPLDRGIIFPFLASLCFLGSPFSILGVLGVCEPLSVKAGGVA